MKLNDEQIYQRVADEIRTNGPREGLWLKALTQSLGDEHKAKFVYTKLRVDQLKSEIRVTRRKEIFASDTFKNLVIILFFALVFVAVNLIFDYALEQQSRALQDKSGTISLPPNQSLKPRK